MLMEEIVQEVSFRLGIPSNRIVEGTNVEQSVLIAFREVKRYLGTPTMKTVPYARRIDLLNNGIRTNRVRGVVAAYPKVGLGLSNVESGNVFQLAAATNYAGMLNPATYNLDPVINQLAMAQVANCMSTDFQWRYDLDNQCIYITCKAPKPSQVTIEYVPDYQDVSEINSPTWIDIMIRLSEAYMKKSLGRSRSKYTVSGSNVSLDGDTLLNEANAELEALRAEMEQKSSRLIALS